MKKVIGLVGLLGLLASAGFNAQSQTLVGGLINGQVWTMANSPYIATNDLNVSNLTIQPGVVVECANGVRIVISGFIQASGMATNQITFQGTNVDGGWGGILFSNASTNCQVQYCMIQGANNSGLRLHATPITIQNCTITGNSAGFGGGINTDGTLTLIGCTVTGNSVSSSSAKGGGIYSSGGGSTAITLISCSINGNHVSAIDARGAGIACDGGTLILTDSTISGNSAAGNQCADSFCHNYASGGGVYSGGSIVGFRSTITGNSVGAGDYTHGAGIHADGLISLTNCDISGNTGYSSYGGSYGGGIDCYGIVRLLSCRISGNGVHFTGCCAGPSYGGAAMNCSDSAYDIIANCIIAGNVANEANGISFNPAIIFHGASGTADIRNNVFYANNNRNAAQVFLGGAGTVENCIFYGNEVGPTGMSVNYSMVPGGYGGTNNIDANIPINQIFTDTSYFFLADSCPGIDAGDPDSQFNDVNFPPSKGGVRNDMGAYGGSGTIQNLIFVPALRITTQPTSQNVDFGSTVQLAVGVTGADGPLSYQWRFNGTNIVNATNSSYTITNFAISDIGAYAVAVSDVARTVTSSSALLDVATLSIKMYAGVTLNGNIGESFLIQSTPALGSGATWTDLTNITLTSPTFIYFDPRSATNVTQFYRAIPE